MSIEQRRDSNFDKFKSLKDNFAVPLKIKMFYSLLEDTCNKNELPTVSKDHVKKHKLLLTTFKRQSNEQKQRFLYQSFKLIKSSLNKDNYESNSSESDGMDLIKQIQTTCKVKQTIIGFAKWEKRSFKLNMKNYKIKIGENKKEVVFNLPFYFVRKSNKYSKTLILQAISDSVQPSKSEIYISFDDNTLFNQIYNHIFTCIIQINSKQLLKLANQKQDNEDISTNTNDQMSKASTILTSKVLNQYFSMKDKIMRKLQQCSYNFENVQTHLPKTKIGISRHKNKDRIKIEKIYNGNLQTVAADLSILHRQTDGSLIQFQILQTFSTNINVVYLKYFFGNEVYEFLTILQENSKKDERNLIFKGIDNFINKQFVDFLTLKLKENDQGQVILNLMGIIKNEQKNKNNAKQFLLSLIQLRKTAQTKVIPQQQFWTVKQMQNIEMDDENICYNNEIGKQIQDENKEKKSFQIQSIKVNFLNQNLKKKYIIDPTPNSVNKFLSQHPLFTQWKIHKNGGVLCTNEQQINQQKKVFKYIISKIGSNIIQRKSILNFSFPVTIFKKQSHLKSVARNFSFAPTFLQKAATSSPEQKIKYAILFQISTAILVISMNKPFNPILGETYQGYIDECPIFLEQISHHPPICRYIFYGRGYKIYGTIEPKVAIGLNCAKGWSPPINYIEFQDGTVLQMTMNKMVINGMLFGQRTFNFEGKNFIIDQKNKLAAQITYGNEGNSVFKKKQLTYDSVSGAAYRIQSTTLKINGENFKKDENQRLLSFNGKWHSQIKINNQRAFNFQTDLPHELIDHQYPIPSDSCYRIDLAELILGNMDKAQQQKDFMEQMQRRDKKLREQYSRRNKEQS